MHSPLRHGHSKRGISERKAVFLGKEPMVCLELRGKAMVKKVGSVLRELSC